MEENNSFKQKALSHIPLDIQRSMLESTKVTTEGVNGILEALAKNVPNSSPLPVQKPEVTKDNFTTIVINNTALKVSANPYEASLTMLLYLAATVWSKDKKVSKVLKAFNFSLQDCNGAILYPKQKRGKKK
jgi:hypothetical protein